MKPKLLFATNNENKLREVRDMAGDQLEILSLQDIELDEEIPEPGHSIEENAYHKAYYIHMASGGMECIADDTGLEIEALDGRPGVISARYAGENCDFEDNIRKVLSEMEGVSNLAAIFRCSICYVRNNKPIFFEGRVYGTILHEKKGSGGFGYDSIFQPKGFFESFAEMPPHLKNGISHRGRAMSKLIRYLCD
jgi:XTP/dITP diphosphohydrolase